MQDIWNPKFMNFKSQGGFEFRTHQVMNHTTQKYIELRPKNYAKVVVLSSVLWREVGSTSQGECKVQSLRLAKFQKTMNLKVQNYEPETQ